MTRYVALNDTVYRFRVIRKGKEIVGGEELDKNVNFARVGAPAADAGKATVSADEKEVRLRAKELKISNWHTKAKDKLLAEIAEAEAKLAAPAAAAATGETTDETVNVPADTAAAGDAQADA